MKDYPIKAFPYEESYMNHGMDLRDYFAAKAMQGMFANSATKQVDRKDLPVFGVVAYEMADAMMKARVA